MATQQPQADLAALVDVLTRFMGSLTGTNQARPAPTASDVLLNTSINFDAFNDEKESFKVYRQRLENFLEIKQLSGQTTEGQKARARVLINCLGSKHYQLLSSLTAPSLPTDKTYDELISLLENHLSPPPNQIIEQHKFLSRVQMPHETIAQYVAALKQQTTSCAFVCPNKECSTSIATVFLRAQFIRGLIDTNIREKLLQDTNLTFERAVQLALAFEASKIGNRVISGENQTKVNKVEAKPDVTYKNRKQSFSSRSNNGRNRTNFKTRIDYKKLGLDGLCLKCGLNNHNTKECRRDRNSLKCTSCTKIGHVSKVCITTLTKTKSNKANASSIKEVQIKNEEEYESENNYNINKVIPVNKTTVSGNNHKFIVPIKLFSKVMNFEVDTGSPVTLINEEDYAKLEINEPIKRTEVLFRAYTGQNFIPKGKVTLPISYGNIDSTGDLYIVPTPYSAIVGRDWLQNLKIITINKVTQMTDIDKKPLEKEIYTKYSQVFQEKVGCVPNIFCSIRVRDENIAPVFLKPRQIPYALQEKVEDELNLMEKQGIIEKTDYSQWGSPLVCVPKPDGNVRLCVDYKTTVNPNLQDARYPIPLIDDVLNTLRGSAVFCVLDIHKAYQHLMVDEEGQRLQTISTHRGTYKMKRLAFGIKIAPNEFQKFIDTALQGLEGVIAYFDDIVVHAKSLFECYKRLESCLNRLQELDLHVNRRKCILFASRIKYLGHIVSAAGIQKSPEKVEAIINAPRPTNITEVRAFVGYVAYYSKFIPNVASILHPIYNLLRNTSEFQWTTACESAFQKIKEEIASDRVLTYYNPKLPLTVTTDASPVGLSAIMSHIINGEERPIAFASRSLTVTEKNYSQLDKEATAIYWGIQKFYPYIYGRHFTLITDNKPLSHIFGRNQKLPTITASRLIRYSMFLNGFDYEIQHRKSEHHANADYLSRAPLPTSNKNNTDEDHDVYNIIIQHISCDPVTFESIKAATAQDNELLDLKNNLLNGKHASPEYSLHDNVIFRGQRIVIPEKLQLYVLQELHSSHQGIVRMKSLARRYCYWKGIDKDIEALARSCQACANVKTNPNKVPLHKWDVPENVWQRVHMDYAGPFQGYYFFIMVDAKSKWPEILCTKTAPTTASTILMMKEIFCRTGLPHILVSDNATIFKSQEFIDFCARNGIKQNFIAPGHPATNGQAERYVATLKKYLKTMNDDKQTMNEKLYEILLRYRATPLNENGKTPAELYMKRNLKTRLDLLRQQISVHNNAKQPEISKHLRLGERVLSRNYASSCLWKPGTIVEKLGQLHYLVELDDGYVIKRHIDQLQRSEVNKKNLVSFAPDIPAVDNQNQTSNDAEISIQTQLPNSITEYTSNAQTENPNMVTNEENEITKPVTPKPSRTIQEQSKVSPYLRRSTRQRKPVTRLNL